jgi:hypothetical protein
MDGAMTKPPFGGKGTGQVVLPLFPETPGLKHEKFHVTILAHHFSEDPHEITAQNLLDILLTVAPLHQPRR